MLSRLWYAEAAAARAAGGASPAADAARFTRVLRTACSEVATLLSLGPRSVAELRMLANATPGTVQHKNMRHQAQCAAIAGEKDFFDDDDDDDGNDRGAPGGGEVRAVDEAPACPASGGPSFLLAQL